MLLPVPISRVVQAPLQGLHHLHELFQPRPVARGYAGDRPLEAGVGSIAPEDLGTQLVEGLGTIKQNVQSVETEHGCRIDIAVRFSDDSSPHWQLEVDNRNGGAIFSGKLPLTEISAAKRIPQLRVCANNLAYWASELSLKAAVIEGVESIDALPLLENGWLPNVNAAEEAQLFAALESNWQTFETASHATGWLKKSVSGALAKQPVTETSLSERLAVITRLPRHEVTQLFQGVQWDAILKLTTIEDEVDIVF